MTTAQSRLAAILLTFATLAIAYFLLLHWWFVAPLMNIDSQMHEVRGLHAKYAAAIAQRPLLEKRLASLQRGSATVGAFLSGTDPSTAAANLIQRATDIVGAHSSEGAGCRMPSKMPIETDRGKSPFRRVSVSITLDCGVQPLAAVLYDFDRSLPYLFVDHLTVSHTSSGRLQAQLTLSGYLQPAGSP